MRYAATSIIITIIIFFCLVFFFPFKPVCNSDAVDLVSGAHCLIRCAERGSLGNCSETWHFPPFQYIITLIMIRLGYSDSFIMMSFVFFNAVSFIGLLLCCFYTLCRSVSLRGAIFAVTILVTTYGISYINWTFNEMTAAFLVAALICACLLNAHPLVIVLLAVSASITKEIIPVFLFSLGGIALWYRGHKFSRKGLLALVIGCIVGILINMSFNFLRFGTWKNTLLLDPIMHVHSNKIWLSFFSGLWFSPNGGLIFFSATLFLCVLPVLLIRFFQERRQIGPSFSFSALLAILGIFTIITAGFAKWYAPFGWVCYGPRFLWPFIPAFMILVFSLTNRQLNIIVDQLVSSWYAVLLTAGLFFCLGIAHYIAFLDPLTGVDHFFAPFPGRPIGYVQQDPSYYYASINSLIWARPSIMLYQLSNCVTRNMILNIFYYIVFIFLLFIGLKLANKHEWQISE